MKNYQKNERKIYEEGLKYVKEKKLAIDVGACIGLWTEWMSQDFEVVIAIEPADKNYEELFKKIEKLNNVITIKIVMQSEPDNGIGRCKLWNSSKKIDKVSGHWTIHKPENIEVDFQYSCFSNLDCLPLLTETFPWLYWPQSLLKDIDYNPNYIKMDVQGAELEVLKGTQITLQRYSPILNIETSQNGKYNPKIKEFLSNIEYSMVKKINKHEIFKKC